MATDEKSRRRVERIRAGLCARCGGTLETRPIINALTGRPRVSDAVPLTERVCSDCGYRIGG